MKKLLAAFFLFGPMMALAQATPSIISITPSQGITNTTVTIYGSNLSGASAVEFYQNGIFKSSLVPNSVSSTNVTFLLSSVFTANTSAGAYEVGVVTNACAGGCLSNKVSFTLGTQPVNMPAITTVNPGQGRVNTSVTIYGSNLLGASAIEFYKNGKMMSSLKPFTVSATQVSFVLSDIFVANTEAGAYEIGIVTNACASGCSSNRLPFSILQPGITPKIDTITPAQGGAYTQVIASGANLSGATSVEFYKDGKLYSSLIPTSSTASQVVFSLSPSFAANTEPGLYFIGVVTNACVGGCLSNRLAFVLKDTAAVAPTITSKPEITTFVSKRLSEDGPATLVLEAKNASNCTINPGVTSLTLGGVFTVNPTQETKYIATCYDSTRSESGAVVASVTTSLGFHVSGGAQLQQTPVQSSNAVLVKNNATAVAIECLDLTASLRYGMRSIDISALQGFLKNKGYLSVSSTGYFGASTFAAVQKFQRAYGISATGLVGPSTRAKLKELSCK